MEKNKNTNTNPKEIVNLTVKVRIPRKYRKEIERTFDFSRRVWKHKSYYRIRQKCSFCENYFCTSQREPKTDKPVCPFEEWAIRANLLSEIPSCWVWLNHILPQRDFWWTLEGVIWQGHDTYEVKEQLARLNEMLPTLIEWV